ncbi:MAG: hypothetical protein ACTHM6_01390 [Tepidisphaeraceae bacterium]
MPEQHNFENILSFLETVFQKQTAATRFHDQPPYLTVTKHKRSTAAIPPGSTEVLSTPGALDHPPERSNHGLKIVFKFWLTVLTRDLHC